jgi:urea transporter
LLARTALISMGDMSPILIFSPVLWSILSLALASVCEKAVDPRRINKKKVEIFFIPFLFCGWMSSRVYKNRKGLNDGILPSLRRHYPDQVLRV